MTLAKATGARLEVNLFYRTAKRERAIARVLEGAGARSVFGLVNRQNKGMLAGIFRKHKGRTGKLVSARIDCLVWVHTPPLAAGR